MGNEARNTVDSAIEFTENRYGSLPLQPGGRKRHADTSNRPWDGPHKRILFESEDPESTLSGSERQEARPGWPPDDMCADSTRYRGSFDDRDREGLRLLSPMFQQKVLKLQRESRYFRARQVENPVIAPNRPRFTSTPVPRYAGGSNWKLLCARTDGTKCCWIRYRRITLPPVDWQSTNANLNE